MVILASGCEFFSAKYAQFSCTIYGKELNERNFSFETVISHFWDKPYQKINFKSHLNSVAFCK